MDSGYILKLEAVEFAKRLDMGCYKKKNKVQDDSRILAQESSICHHPMMKSLGGANLERKFRIPFGHVNFEMSIRNRGKALRGAD